MYEQLYGPLGPERFDQLAALIASTTANAMRSKRRAAKVADFVPKWGPRHGGGQAWEQQLQTAQALAQTLGGEFRPGGGIGGDDRETDDPTRGRQP